MSRLTQAALEWKPPAKIEELFAATSGNKFASINSPVAGPREEKELPEGPAPVQLYSLQTPNGDHIFLSSNRKVDPYINQAKKFRFYWKSWELTMMHMVSIFCLTKKICYLIYK